VVRDAVAILLKALMERGFSEAKLGNASTYILEELRKWVQEQRDLLAEEQFLDDVTAERIQFRLRADRDLWRMPLEIDTDHLEGARQLQRTSGGPIETSLIQASL
jgi:hypothetical protein